MHGKITFDSPESLAKFLIEFTGSTALFEVTEKSNGSFILEFSGGF
jgi:hypothetical protein